MWKYVGHLKFAFKVWVIMGVQEQGRKGSGMHPSCSPRNLHFPNSCAAPQMCEELPSLESSTKVIDECLLYLLYTYLEPHATFVGFCRS